MKRENIFETILKFLVVKLVITRMRILYSSNPIENTVFYFVAIFGGEKQVILKYIAFHVYDWNCLHGKRVAK